MISFLLALLVFLAAHVIPRATGARDWGINTFGRKAYMFAYSAMSLGLLAWLIVAAINAPYWALWGTTQFTVILAMAMMLIACILLCASITRSNSLSISFKGGKTDLQNPGILALVRHPITLTFLLWSGAHLLVNGDVVGLVFFGGLLLFSIIGTKLAARRAKGTLTDAEFYVLAQVDQGTILARLKRAISLKFAAEVAVGVALFVVLLIGHAHVLGVGPLAYF